MISILGHKSVYRKIIIISYQNMNIENLWIIMSKMFQVRVTQFDKQSIIYSLCIIDKSTVAKPNLLLDDSFHESVYFSRVLLNGFWVNKAKNIDRWKSWSVSVILTIDSLSHSISHEKIKLSLCSWVNCFSSTSFYVGERILFCLGYCLRYNVYYIV